MEVPEVVWTGVASVLSALSTCLIALSVYFKVYRPNELNKTRIVDAENRILLLEKEVDRLRVLVEKCESHRDQLLVENSRLQRENLQLYRGKSVK